MNNDDHGHRFLRFARAIALVSGAALPLGATLPACTEDAPPTYLDAGLAVDAGATVDAGLAVDTGSSGVDVYRPPADTGTADVADASKVGYDVTGGPLMPPEFDEGRA